MPRPLTTRAPAKINLTLHVLARRPDGYHDLESLVAFATTGDTLSLEPADDLLLEVEGVSAPLCGDHGDNLVLKAARFLREGVPGLRTGKFHLVKRLPVAAGIGGGSSDAAAALRLLARLNGIPLAHGALREAARLTGADVPVCLDPRARMMRGLGEALGPPLRLPSLFAVLVNPGVPVQTPAVFKALALAPGQTLANAGHPIIAAGIAERDLLDALQAARNDLQPPACSVEPEIAGALRLLSQVPGCRLARMSGSGATVFGLFQDAEAAAAAAKALEKRRSGWWVKATILR